MNGIDVDPLGPYVAALDNPAYPVPAMRWTSQHSARIEGAVQNGQIVSVQITYHPGWHAIANGRAARIHADALGQMVSNLRVTGRARSTSGMTGAGSCRWPGGYSGWRRPAAVSGWFLVPTAVGVHPWLARDSSARS